MHKRNSPSGMCVASTGIWRRFFVPVAMVILAAGLAEAATTVWVGPSSGGVFNDDANWSSLAPGHTTPATDLGIFNSDTNVDGTITFSADITHYRAFVQNNAGTISFDTGSHKWTMTSYFLVGAADTFDAPTIRHIGGEIQSDFVLLGTEESGPNPSIELTGSTTHWHTTRGSGGYQIGLQSSGAKMLVHNGAEMSADGQVIVGLVGSSNSKLTIDGVGSQLNAGNYIGVGHTGSEFGPNATGNKAEIINGATATASNVYMAITAGAPDNQFLVSGAASTLTLTGVNGNDGSTTTIGWRANGNLFQIDNGGAVAGTNYFVLGLEATSSDNHLLINNGSLSGTGLEVKQGEVTLTSATVDLIQYLDEAMMLYKGGGVVANNGAASIFTFNSGTVRSVNADVNNGSAFTVGNGGGSPATYFMRPDVAGSHGTHSFANGLVLSSNGILAGNGNVVGNVSGSAGGKVDVGASAGRIQVTGNWNNTGLAIALELDDLAASLTPGVQFDQLSVSGEFTHGGTVTIDRSQLVAPATEQQVKLIGWGSQAGLSNSTVVSFLGGSPLAYSFQSDGLYLTVGGGGLMGDYNANGVVDAADYTVWRNTLNQTGTGLAADGDSNGVVNQADYALWKTHFGEGTGSASVAAGAAVPEPTTWGLALGLAAFGLRMRRRCVR